MKQLVFFVLFFFCSITFYPFVVVVSSLVINIMEVEAISNQPVAWWFGFYWSNFIYITTTPWIKEGNMRRLIDYPPTTNLSFSSMYFSTSTSNPPTQPSTSFLFFLQFNDDSTLDDIDNSPLPLHSGDPSIFRILVLQTVAWSATFVVWSSFNKSIE